MREKLKMCGIVAYLDKSGKTHSPVGQVLLKMLQALGCRGPDSAGIALFGPRGSSWILQLNLSASCDAHKVIVAVEDIAEVRGDYATADYLRIELDGSADPAVLEELLLARAPNAEIVSLGRQLEIVKQVGSPDRLEQTFGISQWKGSHAIGHTRMSTESKVDLSHSQPFWARGVPDLATVHNGHITNYHKMRRQYEQRGYRFYTENDSELIGVYLRDRMAAGLSLEDALRSSVDDFDGSFTYVAADGDHLAYVRDRYAFKPLIVAETDDFVALATEEIALRQSLGSDFEAREPGAGTVGLWNIGSPVAVD